jgi:hypothetical protein
MNAFILLHSQAEQLATHLIILRMRGDISVKLNRLISRACARADRRYSLYSYSSET